MFRCHNVTFSLRITFQGHAVGAAVAARHSNDNARGQVQWGHARATAAAWIVFPVAIAPRPLRFRGHHDTHIPRYGRITSQPRCKTTPMRSYSALTHSRHQRPTSYNQHQHPTTLSPSTSRSLRYARCTIKSVQLLHEITGVFFLIFIKDIAKTLSQALPKTLARKRAKRACVFKEVDGDKHLKS